MSDNLYGLLASRFPTDRSRPCFRLPGGAAIAYGDFETRIGRAAAALRSAGVAPGDRVALQVEKSIEAVVIYLAALKVGAVFLPLNAAYTEGEVDYFLRDAEPALFLRDAQAFLS
ncbi:MAG: AMP-binding protein, partial [Phenylobacterium sp.]